jgi:hypothetical protein
MAFYPLAKRSSMADAFLIGSGTGFVFEFYLAYSRRALAALALSLMLSVFSISGSLNLDFNLVATI